MIGWLIYAVALAFRALTLHLDADASKRYLFYAMEEGVKKHRNNDGSARVGSIWFWGLIIPLPISVGLLIGTYFGLKQYPEQAASASWAPQLVGAGILIAVSIYTLRIWQGNVAKMKRFRVEQKAWRKEMRYALDVGDEYEYIRLLDPESEVAGVYYPERAPWLTVVASNETEAKQMLKPVLRAWVDIPDNNLKAIWHDLKYHS
jgi:hypothetical protein